MSSLAPPRPMIATGPARETTPNSSLPSSTSSRKSFPHDVRMSNPSSGAGPSSPIHFAKSLKKLRPWTLSVAGKRKSNWNLSGKQSQPTEFSIDEPGSSSAPYSNYSELRARDHRGEPGRGAEASGVQGEGQRGEDAYEWEVESVADSENDPRVDVYTCIDPNPNGKAEQSPGAPSGPEPPTSSPDRPVRQRPPIEVPLSSTNALRFPEPPRRPSPRPLDMHPGESYNLLLSYQSIHGSIHGSDPDTSNASSQQHDVVPMSPTTDASQRLQVHSEWHEMVDPSIIRSLPRQEVRRQGLWWELIKGEMAYVQDLRTTCDYLIQPLLTHAPPLLLPETRVRAFVAEVFSTIPQIYRAHQRLLERLMIRQREQWPLLTSATDLLLGGFVDMVDLYETYMKNYPFAEARVRRETQRNSAFRQFLSDRNTLDISGRRDVSVFLSRPVTRLPRILLLLDALNQCTPPDHPDKEEIPTIEQILTSALKGSQPGIESAEAKIKLWNVAERLLFKKGEIIELDVGEPKRSLVYAGYLFRRVRSETSWHGWQDLHAFLLDNYLLLTRDEENGKHVVVSRPIHLDFLTLLAADGVPERRYEYVTQYRRGRVEPPQQPERLMFPFTIATSGGINGRTYTLCTATQASRDQWKERIEGAKTLRKFDMDSNGIFASHRVFTPPEAHETIMAADTFSWLGRETMAVATARAVWIGWRRDSRSYRELIRFSSGLINAVSILPTFGRLLVVHSGALIAFDLHEMMPTSEPATWNAVGRLQGRQLNSLDHNVAFARVGTTKDRLLVIYAAHARNTHQTLLSFHEPLLPAHDRSHDGFRLFASITVPGYASDLSFFRQTIAVVTENAFVIAEPGNPTHHSIPTFPSSIAPNATVVRMVSGARPMAMFQIAENEFLLAYDWGACFVTKFGEVSRNGAFLRWNLLPSAVVFRPPHLLLFDEADGRAEVRDVSTGRVCEVIEERGMRPIRLTRQDQALLAFSPKGLLELKETEEL